MLGDFHKVLQLEVKEAKHFTWIGLIPNHMLLTSCLLYKNI